MTNLDIVLDFVNYMKTIKISEDTEPVIRSILFTLENYVHLPSHTLNINEMHNLLDDYKKTVNEKKTSHTLQEQQQEQSIQTDNSDWGWGQYNFDKLISDWNDVMMNMMINIIDILIMKHIFVLYVEKYIMINILWEIILHIITIIIQNYHILIKEKKIILFLDLKY
jgi:hypothetical protein